MTIIEKNEGPKIPYTIEETVINFDERLELDLQEYQTDCDEHITVFRKRNGQLTTCRGGIAYVAEIDIPPVEYSAPGEGQEPEPLPLDMQKITLTLWALV